MKMKGHIIHTSNSLLFFCSGSLLPAMGKSKQASPGLAATNKKQ
jgi:hypothetical protein